MGRREAELQWAPGQTHSCLWGKCPEWTDEASLAEGEPPSLFSGAVGGVSLRGNPASTLETGARRELRVDRSAQHPPTGPWSGCRNRTLVPGQAALGIRSAGCGTRGQGWSGGQSVHLERRSSGPILQEGLRVWAAHTRSGQTEQCPGGTRVQGRVSWCD